LLNKLHTRYKPGWPDLSDFRPSAYDLPYGLVRCRNRTQGAAKRIAAEVIWITVGRVKDWANRMQRRQIHKSCQKLPRKPPDICSECLMSFAAFWPETGYFIHTFAVYRFAN